MTVLPKDGTKNWGTRILKERCKKYHNSKIQDDFGKTSAKLILSKKYPLFEISKSSLLKKSIFPHFGLSIDIIFGWVLYEKTFENALNHAVHQSFRLLLSLFSLSVPFRQPGGGFNRFTLSS
jgi:hypothetical protein